jgi:hypothetical protein
MKSSTVFLLFAAGCAVAPRVSDDAGSDAGHVVQFATHCGKVLVDPYTLCVNIPNVMTFEPDGGDCHNWQGWCLGPSVAPVKVPENCWNSPTCACLQDAGISLCPIPGTACQDVVTSGSQLFCGCTGSCCFYRPDGASVWTCACKNLDGTPWCMNSAVPQTCTDTPEGARCSVSN